MGGASTQSRTAASVDVNAINVCNEKFSGERINILGKALRSTFLMSNLTPLPITFGQK